MKMTVNSSVHHRPKTRPSLLVLPSPVVVLRSGTLSSMENRTAFFPSDAKDPELSVERLNELSPSGRVIRVGRRLGMLSEILCLGFEVGTAGTGVGTGVEVVDDRRREGRRGNGAVG